MRTKEISNHLLDGAIDLTMYALPGMIDIDEQARLAFRELVSEVFLTQPSQHLKRMIDCQKGPSEFFRRANLGLDTLEKLN